MSGGPTVLVAGSRKVDAGKTTFAVGLVDELDGVAIKPRAGNDYWYDHDTVSAAAAAGTLVGKDAKRLARASVGDLQPAAINPLHRLWRPIPHGTGGIFGRERSEFLVDRVADEYVVNAGVDIPPELRRGFDLDEAIRVNTLAEMNEVMRERHRPALDRVRPILETDRPVVIESYADVARPLQDVAIDAVAVVGAGRLAVYDGDRYCRAAEIASGSADMGRLEERVGDVVDLIQPVATTDMPPLTSDRRSDPSAVAGAYANAYEVLLEATG